MAKTPKASSSKAIVVAPPSPSSSSAASSTSSRSASPEDEEAAKPVVNAGASQKKLQGYQPPAGFKAVKCTADEATGVDWAVLNANPELELWAVRVPVGIKARHLDGLSIQVPANFTDDSSAKSVGTLNTKKAAFDVYLSSATASTSSSKRRRDGEEVDASQGPSVGNNEMQEFVALLPKKGAGGDRLYEAPRPISRHLTMLRSVPATILSHLPSASSSLIASQPAPVPGAVLSVAELRSGSGQEKKKVRQQPPGLRFRIDLGGMKAKGGQGLYDNKPEPVVVPEPVVMESPKKKSKKAVVEPAEGEEDVEMADGDADVNGEETKVKKVKKEKKVKEEKKGKKVKKEKV